VDPARARYFERGRCRHGDAALEAIREKARRLDRRAGGFTIPMIAWGQWTGALAQFVKTLLSVRPTQQQPGAALTLHV
jgi:hypothetical protein